MYMCSLLLKRFALILLQISLSICLFSSHVLAQEESTRVIVQLELDSLGKLETLTANQQTDQSFLVETLSLLDDIEQEQANLHTYVTRLRTLPLELTDIHAKFEALTQEASAEQIKDEFTGMSLDTLDRRQSELMLSLQYAQEALDTINGQITHLQVLPERTRTSMSQAYLRGQDIRTQLNTDNISGAEALKLNTELALLDLRVTLLQKGLDNRTSLQDVVLKQRSYLNARLAADEQTLAWLQAHISARHLRDTQQALDHADALMTAQSHPLIHQAQKINRQLSEQVVSATTNLNQLAQKNMQAKGWLKRSTQTERNLNEQVQILKGNLLLPRLLYQRYQQLERAPFSLVKNLEEQIADLHLTQFELSQQRDQLSQPRYLNNLIAKIRSPISKEDKASLTTLLDSRIGLLEQLNRQLDSQLSNAISLQLTQQQLVRINSAIKFTLQQHIFWVNSNKPIDSTWFMRWPAQAEKQVDGWVFKPSWSGWHDMWQPVSLLLLGILLLFIQPSLLRRQQCLAKNLGRLRHDSQWHTPRALFYSVLRQLPGCFFILSGGLWLSHSDLLSPALTLQITLNLTLGYLVFSVYLAVMRPEGIGEHHFGMSKAALQAKHTHMRWLWLPLLPLIMLSTKAVMEPSSLGSDVVGQALSLLLLGLTPYLVFLIAHVCGKDEGRMKASLIGVALVPLVQAALIVLGYYYTALKLTSLLIGTFYLIIIWSLVYRSALRGLALAARRLAYQRLMTKRTHMVQDESEGTDAMEEPLMDLREVSQQSLRLTRTALLLVFGVAFYALWPDLVVIFSYLDNIVLWNKSDSSGANTVLYPISMSDVLTALFMLGATWSLARNLPGLLEVLVLSKLRLAQGTAYAFTTMLNYVLIGVGTLTALSLMGMQWDKLQWLAAGLMVGIGFGLQEIVGNFVSGIIILFERPVRIGDTVTIGTFSGAVTKIRIRATTITDFDRKEVIIPNKALMTERLTNWSLTDTVTRVIVRVGIAYGSDLALTRRLLMQVAKENSRVLKEPEPLVYFLTFGPSTLDHELRVFVSELIDRNPAIDELNRRIDELFREHGIDIAFNQVEVRIKEDIPGTLTGQSVITKKEH